MKHDKKLFTFDFETSGGSPEFHDALQLGVQWLDKDFSFIKQWKTYIQPVMGRVSQDAMAINKISAEQLMGAPTWYDVIAELERQFPTLPNIKDWEPASWGNYFDLPFLLKGYKTIGRRMPFEQQDFQGVIKSFDIKTVVKFELRKMGFYNWQHIDGALEVLGLRFEGTPHDALDDIHNANRLLRIVAGVSKEYPAQQELSPTIKERIPT